MSQNEREFREWLDSPFALRANMVGDPEVPNKVILLLPDRGAYIERGGDRPLVRDVETDEILFRGRSDPDLYRQLSKFYGVEVAFTNELTNATKTFGSRGNPRKAPAARGYGIEG